ncbi:tail fiber domain-containing protein [bacterium]|nr:tail fiber domain-containing protein [bacterium]
MTRFLTGALRLIFAVLLFSQWPIANSQWQTRAEAAEPNKYISFQGQLSDSTGARINGNVSATFKLWSVPTGGTALWTEAQTMAADNGVTSATLGSVTGLTLPFDTQYWLGVTVGSDAEMSPRIRLAAAPYAFTAYSLTDSALARGTLKVAGAATFSDSLIVSDTVLFVNKQTGRVATGTSSPTTAQLHVEGQIYLRSNGGAQMTILNLDATAGSAGAARVTLVPQNAATQQDIWGIDGAISLRTGGVPGVVSASERIRISSAGAVGVGTAAPTDSLHVGGRILMDTNTQTAASDGAIRWSGSDFEGRKAGSWVSLTSVGTVSPSSLSSAITSDSIAADAVTSAKILDGTIANADLASGSFPSVTGVGTLGTLTVSGTSAFSDSVVVSDTVLVVNKQSGKVGVGTAGPAGSLHVKGSNTLWTNPHVEIEHTTSGSSKIMQSSSGLLFRNFNPTGTNVAFDFRDPTLDLSTLTILANRNVGVATGAPADSLHVNGTLRVEDTMVVGDTWLVVDKSGRVGVGTTSPAYPLHVSGGNSQVRFGSSNADEGGYLISTTNNQALVTGGGSWNGTNWIAKSTEFGYMGTQNGSVVFQGNDGLTPGSSFTPKSLMRVDVNGNVGIRTSAATPADSLQVAGRILMDTVTGTGGADGAIRWSGSDFEGRKAGSWVSLTAGGIGGDSWTINHATNVISSANSGKVSLGSLTVSGVSSFSDSLIVSDTVLVVNKQSGNVGVGTASPAFPLSFPNTLGDKIALYGASGNNFGLGVQSFLMQIHTSGSNEDIGFGYGQSGSFSEVMRIKGTGNVGIATAAPADSLTVNGSLTADSPTLVVHSGNNRIGVRTDNPRAPVEIKNGVLGWQDHILLSGSSAGTAYWIGRNDDEDGTAEPTDRLAFGTGTTAGTNAAMHISSNGNISIGDTPAPEKLAVFGSMMVDSPTFYVDAVNNRVGIGTSAPDTTFSVNGEASKAGGGTWNTFSDGRLKDINGEFTAGAEELMKLRPIRYRYKRDNPAGIREHAEHVGLVAQEVQSAIPEAVYANNQGYLMLKSDPIIWAMLNAIKQQQAEIATLRAEMEVLRGAAR